MQAGQFIQLRIHGRAIVGAPRAQQQIVQPLGIGLRRLHRELGQILLRGLRVFGDILRHADLHQRSIALVASEARH